MESKRIVEIKEAAQEINTLSEHFQLIHATYATQEIIKEEVRSSYLEKTNALAERIKAKIEKDLNADEELAEKRALEELIKRNRFSINIGYINVSNEDIARVVKEGNSFTIYLASSLRDTIFDKEGKYNYSTISKIRKLMSHELGHLVLHTNDLLSEDGTQGSIVINDDEKEAEATLFGKELLLLRKERNKQISSDGGAENLF